MEKLELKHLSPYLPYELKGRYYPTQNKSVGTVTIDCETLHRFENELDKLKPILRPLDSVCDGMNDETPNPCFDELDEGSKDCFRCLSDQEALDVLPYSDMIILFKYHIDVFGLIPKGLAIDINTIK